MYATNFSTFISNQSGQISEEYKKMNNVDYSSLVPGFTSSESDIIHDYNTTMNSTEIAKIHKPYGTDMITNIGLAVVALFILAILYRFSKAYLNRHWERAQWLVRDFEWCTPPITPSTSGYSRGNYIQLRNLNRENLDEEQGDTESSTSYSFFPEQNEVRISLPECYDESALPEKHDNSKGLYFEFLKESPASFSTPRESKEGLLLPTIREGIGYESSAENPMPGCSKNFEEKSSEKVNVALSEHSAIKKSPLPEGGSQSSPTSPDPIRRRHPSSEDTRERPSSWV